ncbi:MAG: large conductance mechanosensitive channel protein MscL [Chthoniobacteraceae bacterium]
MDFKSILGEFKTFILKGNVVDLAVGVLIGAAFGGIVKAFTDGIVKPLLGLFGGDPNVSMHLGVFDIGIVISATIGFMITAAVIFFFVVKPMNFLSEMTRRKAEDQPEKPAPLPDDVKLLMEIRDLLKGGHDRSTTPPAQDPAQ